MDIVFCFVFNIVEVYLIQFKHTDNSYKINPKKQFAPNDQKLNFKSGVNCSPLSAPVLPGRGLLFHTQVVSDRILMLQPFSCFG